MALSTEDVQKIAKLALINVSSDEISPLTTQLSGILDFVAQMDTINTDNVTAIAHSLDMTQRLRPDRVCETDQHIEFQKIAPAVEAGLYLVPKVIETV